MASPQRRTRLAGSALEVGVTASVSRAVKVSSLAGAAWTLSAVFAGHARANVASDVEALTGARTKIAFVRRSDDPGWSGDDWDAKSPNWTLMAFDSADGSERVLVPGPDSFYVPTITPDGTRVIYSSWTLGKVFIVDWDGQNRRELVLPMSGPYSGYAGLASCVHRDSGGTEWVYAASSDYQGPVYRFQIDNPAVNELVWDQFNVGPRFRVSADGLHAAFENADGTRNAYFAGLPNGVAAYYDSPDMDACNTQLAPDNSYRVFNMIWTHQTLEMYDAGGVNARSVDVTIALGFTQWNNMWAPRWSNDARFFTITGPLDSGGSLPSANVFLAEFDAAFSAVEDYVQVTTIPCSNYAYAWIDPGIGGPMIDSFTASPDTIAPGESGTLSWQTSDATSVTLDGDPVGASGSLTVSPAETSTYTLVAEDGSTTKSRQVTVTVGDPSAVHIAINCGPGAVAGWEADDAYVSGGNDFTFPGTPDTSGVADPAPAEVYRTCRHLEPSFSVPVPDGTYTVRLHFYDEYPTRQMTVTIEGQVVLQDFDIAGEAGGAGKALVKEFSATVSDGSMDIAFDEAAGGDAFVSGLEILSGGSPPPPPPPPPPPEEPSIDLISPDGGEVWYVGTEPRITWTAVNLTNVSVIYSTQDGAAGSWRDIAGSIHEFDPEWGAYPWTVPDEPSTSCRVMVRGYFGDAPTQSAETFEIRAVTDTDGDGMDDTWETEQFGDLSHDRTTDADGDGITDCEEFRTVGDPNVPDSSGGYSVVGTGCAPRASRYPCGPVVLAVFALLAARRTRQRRIGWPGFLTRGPDSPSLLGTTGAVAARATGRSA